jgi:excisionase family DNA binding protein
MSADGSLPQGLLTPTQVARFLKVSRRTVWRWTKQGLLPPPLQVGPHSPRWRAEDIRRFLDAQRGH